MGGGGGFAQTLRRVERELTEKRRARMGALHARLEEIER